VDKGAESQWRRAFLAAGNAKKCLCVSGVRFRLVVIVNHVVPAMVRDQAIDRGEIDAALPFRRGHRRRWAGFGVDVHGEFLIVARWTTRIGSYVGMVTKLAFAF
jgi:hypothetical protein